MCQSLSSNRRLRCSPSVPRPPHRRRASNPGAQSSPTSTRPQDAAQLRPLRRRRRRPGHFGDRRRGHAVLRERLRSRRRVQVQQLQARGKGIYSRNRL